jgi:hypothetical protein
MPIARIERSRPAQARTITGVLGVTLVVVASVCSIASQSNRFVGVHEVPPFVCDRVELVPDLAVDGSLWEPCAGERLRWLYAATAASLL